MVGIGTHSYFLIKLPTDFYDSIHREASQPRREPEVLHYHMRRRSAFCL